MTNRRFHLLLALAGLALSICRPLTAQPYGLTQRPEVEPFLNGALPERAPEVAGDWSAVPAFPNLTFTNALGLAAIPGTDKLCVWEREGRVWSFDNDHEEEDKALILDISDRCQGWDDSGMLGLAFHPQFEANRHVYVYYTWVEPGTVAGNALTRPATVIAGAYHDRLTRFTMDQEGRAIPESELVLVDQSGDSVWHNGGGLFFHPDNGFLYWSAGDDIDRDKSQTLTGGLFSGVFRIDVDQRGGDVSHPIPRQPENGVTAHYYIPNDNPFVGQPNVLEEYFCLGLRNPHRMTIDPPSGRIFIGDVGAALREEVNVIEPGESGLNFQWERIEGLAGDLLPPFPGINRRPILDYGREDGNAIIGGYVYRGSEFAESLGGRYLFGDNVRRTIWMLDESTSPAGKVPLCVMPQGSGPNSGFDYTGLSSLGVDADNEIYLCQLSSIGGQIYKLARSGPPAAERRMPLLLSETGTFSDLTTLTPAPGLIPYSVNSPLWSDGAQKDRWMAVPEDEELEFSPTGEWSFPAGTVFVKHFTLATNAATPMQRRRLETRLLVVDTNQAVYGASYKWRPDGSDAELVLSSTREEIPITDPQGDRMQHWSYPGTQDCLRCHRGVSGGVLGVNTRQLNGDAHYSTTGVTDNQLRALNHIGLFEEALDESAIAGFPQLAAIGDESASLEKRARSYLDANCAHCHRPNGVRALFDARFGTPLDMQGLLNGEAIHSLGIARARIVARTEPERSVLLTRISASDSLRMPPLARNVVDEQAVALFTAWIETLPPLPPLSVTATATPISDAPAPQWFQFAGIASGGSPDFAPIDLTDQLPHSVSARGEFDSEQEGVAQLFDNDPSTKWLDFANHAPATRSSWIQVRSDAPASPRVTRYALTSANDEPTRDPGSWRLLGSNDDGASWTTLDVRSNEIFSERLQRRSFSVANKLGFALYRLQIDRVANPALANSVQLAELELIVEPAFGFSWSFGDGHTSSQQDPVHVYTSGGSFNATLTVRDGFNQAAAMTTVTVSPSSPHLIALINFQPGSAPAPPAGYLDDRGAMFDDRGNGFHYGWSADNTAKTARRNSPDSPDPLHDTLIHSGSLTWEMALPNGLYQARLVAGDPDASGERHSFQLEGALFLDGQTSSNRRFIEKYGTVRIADGRLTLAAHSPSNANKLNFIEIRALPQLAPQWIPQLMRFDQDSFVSTFRGAPGLRYVLETSTDLIHWTPVATNSAADAVIEWDAPIPPGASFRFYRTRNE